MREHKDMNASSDASGHPEEVSGSKRGKSDTVCDKCGFVGFYNTHKCVAESKKSSNSGSGVNKVHHSVVNRPVYEIFDFCRHRRWKIHTAKESAGIR
jgi:hypothetical protein